MDDYEIEIIVSDGRAIFLPYDKYELAVILRKLLRLLHAKGHKLQNIELLVVDDGSQIEYNREFLHSNAPTNIISFPVRDFCSGSLVISNDTFWRECHLYGQDPASYLLRLLAHGLAHLCGLEHGEEMDKLCVDCLETLQEKQ